MNIIKDYPLGEILWYEIGGSAKYLLECRTPEDIQESLRFIQQNNISNYFVAGLGANLLVSDAYFDGAVIKLYRDSDIRKIHKDENGIVTAFAGELLDDVIQFCFQNNLKGLEWAGGLPSTVGGAVRGNVGAFGHEIKEHIDSVTVLDRINGEVTILDNEQLNFSYRTSTVKLNKNLIVMTASFRFEPGSSELMAEAKKVYHDNNDYRKINHPIEYPSCGSTFKNIKDSQQVEKVLSVFPQFRTDSQTKWHGKVAIGPIITALGLKGYKKGCAQISEKHANFIINLGGASFDDVYGIIQEIKKKFTETFGFEPEPEVEIIQ